MKCLTYFLIFAVALFCASIAAAVNIDFDLLGGTLTPNPPAGTSPPDTYHSGPIGFDPLLINPGETRGIWVTFKDMMHLEVIDEPSNSDGVERLVTHVRGQVQGDPVSTANLWVDVILSGVTGHIRESFFDPNSTHPTRPPLGDPSNPDDRPSQDARGDDLLGDWDGAYDNSGTDLWNLFHENIVVDIEDHEVADDFVLETWADDLTDDVYLFHDIHWEITNHGNNAVEITSVEFWQDGNILRFGEWIPEPSSLMLVSMSLACMSLSMRRRRG